MVTLMSLQARREGLLVQGNDDGGGVDRNATTTWFPAALGIIAGLATASSAITAAVAMSEPPPVLQGTNDGSYYLLALSLGLFYAGVAELGGAVWVMADPHAPARTAVGRRLVYASLAPLTAAAGLAARGHALMVKFSATRRARKNRCVVRTVGTIAMATAMLLCPDPRYNKLVMS